MFDAHAELIQSSGYWLCFPRSASTTRATDARATAADAGGEDDAQEAETKLGPNKKSHQSSSKFCMCFFPLANIRALLLKTYFDKIGQYQDPPRGVYQWPDRR